MTDRMMKRQRPRQARRYAEHATRRGGSPRDPRRIKYILALIIGMVLVITLALVWGNILKARSDAYHQSHPSVEWTLDEEITAPVMAEPSIGDAAVMVPGGAVPKAYEAALLDLGVGTEDSPYASEVLSKAGLLSTADRVDLSDDIARVHAWGISAAGLFTVTSLSETDPVMAAYSRGLELARLTECATAGLDEIMLMGLPTGDITQDTAAAAYVTDLKKTMSTLDNVPVITVILPMQAYAEQAGDGSWSYDRLLTPGRLLSACDGLVLDLTATTAEDIAAVLQGMQYPYVRYGLRLLINGEATVPDMTTDGGESVTVEALAREHGFERLMVWRPAELSE